MEFQLTNNLEFQEQIRALQTQYFIEEMKIRGKDLTRAIALSLKNQMKQKER